MLLYNSFGKINGPFTFVNLILLKCCPLNFPFVSCTCYNTHLEWTVIDDESVFAEEHINFRTPEFFILVLLPGKSLGK